MNKNKMGNSVDPDELAHNELSSGSTLFAKVYVLVIRDIVARCCSTIDAITNVGQ